MATIRKSSEPKKKTAPPARTPQARENQLIALAFDEAERQLRDHTASSQIITQILKLGSEREQLEREKLRTSNKLDQARIESMAQAERIEELYSKAMTAFSAYRGEEVEDEY